MRFSGNSDPASRSGPLGHVSTRLNPARIAERYSVRSAVLRPGASSIFNVSPFSNRVSALAGVDLSGAPLSPVVGVVGVTEATSPLALRLVESAGVAALALGLALQPASATVPAASASMRELRYIMCANLVARGMVGDTPLLSDGHRVCQRGRAIVVVLNN